LRYFLLDEGRVLDSSLDADNAVVNVVRLERSENPKQLAEVVKHLENILKAPQHTELRRALTVWVNRVVPRRFNPTETLPELQDLHEVHQMISERVDGWTQQWLQQGMQQGLQQGQADFLRHLLVSKFGVLPTEINSKIEAATHDQIKIWFESSVNASSLDAVFKIH
jgi:hypothetical protein